ncbi:GmrSD restriction endonuclease domain-containing protein [Stenotrophomonas sp. PSU-St19]
MASTIDGVSNENVSKLEFENLDLEVQDGSEDDEEAYVAYDIASYPADYTLGVIEAMWQDGEIVVPTFQRKFVWTIRQASLLIESLLMGLPVPQAFFYVDPSGKNMVIDGLQRIKSIVAFFSGEFGEKGIHTKVIPFRLTGLSEKSPYAGCTFGELAEADKRKLKYSVLRVINVRQLGPKDDDTSAYHIFERLNTGGTPLTVQEIRHCVYHGEFVNSLIDLNMSDAWRKILGKDAFDKHQKDVELVLRTFAVFSRADLYEKPMKEFLNKAMAANVAGDSKDAIEFVRRFPPVVSEFLNAVGPKPFHIKGRLNASALDSVLGVLLTLGDVPKNIRERYKLLIADEEFTATLSVSTSDAAVVKRRLAIVRKYIVG